MNTYLIIGEINGVELIATPERLNKLIHDCLCDGLHYFGGYGIDIGYNTEQYKLAKEQLVEQGKGTCFEDIIMQMLLNGGALNFNDVEGDGENDSSLILNEQTYNRFRKIPTENLINLIKEEYDAGDADVVLQTLLYGEVMFG